MILMCMQTHKHVFTLKFELNLVFIFRIYEEIQKIEANEFHYQEQVMQNRQHTLLAAAQSSCFNDEACQAPIITCLCVAWFLPA